MLHKLISETSLFVAFSFLTFIPVGAFTVMGIPSWLMTDIYSPVVFMIIPSIIISLSLASIRVKPKNNSLKNDILKVSLLSVSYMATSIIFFYTFIFFIISHN